MVLAAGAGTRLRPLTDQLPKALVPVGCVPLLDSALDRLAAALGEPGPTPARVAVNAHALAELVARAASGRAHVSREDLLSAAGEDDDERAGARPAAPPAPGQSTPPPALGPSTPPPALGPSTPPPALGPSTPPPALGTAGALGALLPWLDGRSALVTNADAWMPRGPALLADLVRGWDGQRCRLLCEPATPGARADFRTPDGTGVRYVGSCVLPAHLLERLRPEPSGLYEVLWRDLAARPADDDGLDLAVVPAGSALDCGTPADYLRANLLATGGGSAVSPGAVVRGALERAVVWPGAVVEADEHLVDAVRAGTAGLPVTVEVRGPGVGAKA